MIKISGLLILEHILVGLGAIAVASVANTIINNTLFYNTDDNKSSDS